MSERTIPNRSPRIRHPEEEHLGNLTLACPAYASLVDVWYDWWREAHTWMASRPGFPFPYLENFLPELVDAYAPSAFFRERLPGLAPELLEDIDNVCAHRPPKNAITEWAIGEAMARYILREDISPAEQDVSWHLICNWRHAYLGYANAAGKYYDASRAPGLVAWAAFYVENYERLTLPFRLERVRESMQRWKANRIMAEIWDLRRLPDVHFYLARVAWLLPLLDFDAQLFLDCLEAFANPVIIAAMLSDDNVCADSTTLLWLLGHADEVLDTDERGQALWNRKLVAPFLVSTAIDGPHSSIIPWRGAQNVPASTEEETRLCAEQLLFALDSRSDKALIIANWTCHIATEFAYGGTQQLNAHASRRLSITDILIASLVPASLVWHTWAGFFSRTRGASTLLPHISHEIGPHLTWSLYAGWARLQEWSHANTSEVDRSVYQLLLHMHVSPSRMLDASWREYRLAFAIARATDPVAFWEDQWLELECTRVIGRHGIEHEQTSRQKISLYWAWSSFLLLNIFPSPLPTPSYRALLQRTWTCAYAAYVEFQDPFLFKLDQSSWGHLIVQLVVLSLHIESELAGVDAPMNGFTGAQIAAIGGDIPVHVHIATGARRLGISANTLSRKWTIAGYSLERIIEGYIEADAVERDERSDKSTLNASISLRNEILASVQ